MRYASAFCLVSVGLSVLAAVPAKAAEPPTKAQRTLLSQQPLATDPQWGLYVFTGVSAGRTELIKLIPMPWSGDYGDNYFVGGALSRRVGRIGPHWIIDVETGAGYRFKQVNAPEIWVAGFLRYDGFAWNRFIYTTVANGIGLSYVDRVSDVEKDARAPDGSKLLLYLAPELTLALPERRESELVFRFHHRSGVYGTFNGVSGGSNVVTVGFRQRW